MADFVPGAILAQAFYVEVVGPALAGTVHSAALLGTGSDVLGFDTSRSTDHGWGPRLHVFVDEVDVAGVVSRVEAALPETFHGWPTRYGWDAVPVRHHVVVRPLGAWLQDHLGVDPRAGMRTVDWLAVPQQVLLEVTAGPVFHDGSGELQRARDLLSWYPHDVWMWLLACQWRRLDQEEPFVGRTAEVGDELGSRILAARLARDLMRLCLLLDRRYAPYSKWLGSAFAGLAVATTLGPALEAALAAATFADREAALVDAFQVVAGHHNGAGVTRPLPPDVSPFHGRPFQVLGAGRFVDVCLAEVQDPWLRGLPLVGFVDQFVDSTDVLAYAGRARRLASWYEAVTRP
jgi:hypothetical protein